VLTKNPITKTTSRLRHLVDEPRRIPHGPSLYKIFDSVPKQVKIITARCELI